VLRVVGGWVRRVGEFVDQRMLERAVLGRVTASRPGEARRVFYICSCQHEEINGQKKTRTGYDVSGMKVSAGVRVRACNAVV
jgi:hypothetical protein